MINIVKRLDYLLIPFLFCITRLPLLGWDIVNVDAPAWNYRSVQFISYIKNLNFLETYRTYHPGVTVMWLAGIGQEIYGHIHEFYIGTRPEYSIVGDFHWILFSETLPIVIVNFLLILVLYHLLISLLNRKAAFFSTLLLVLEPFFIGNTRVLHLDGLLALFGINSILFYIKYLSKHRKPLLFFSGVFFGLSVLTKVTGLVLLPVVFLISGIDIGGVISLRRVVKNLLIFLLSGFAVFVLMFPAMWATPWRVITKIINDGVLATGQGGQPQIFFGDRTYNPGVFFYPLEFIFRSSPVLFLSLIGALFYNVLHFKKIWVKRETVRVSTVINIFIYALVYLIFITASSKKIDRYIIPLFPPLCIFAGVFLSEIYQRVGHILTVGIVVTFIFITLPIFPDFFAFYNPLAGGTQMAVKVVGLQDWATGYQRVVNYLHTKSEVQSLIVASYNDTSVRPIFKGTTISFDKVADFSKVDYAIVQRNESRLSEIKQFMRLDKIFYIGSYDYYYLYKNSQ